VDSKTVNRIINSLLEENLIKRINIRWDCYSFCSHIHQDLSWLTPRFLVFQQSLEIVAFTP
jgi:hypothetical protein